MEHDGKLEVACAVVREPWVELSGLTISSSLSASGTCPRLSGNCRIQFIKAGPDECQMGLRDKGESRASRETVGCDGRKTLLALTWEFSARARKGHAGS